MADLELSRLELRIIEVLGTRQHASLRETHESFPQKKRPAYTTVQTTGYRVESKKAVRRVKKVGNFHILKAAVTRDAAQRRLIDDLLALLGERLTAGARMMFGGREGKGLQSQIGYGLCHSNWAAPLSTRPASRASMISP